MGENIYILSQNKDAIIIDPGGEEGRMDHYIKEKGLNPKMILLTHGHGDHIFAVDHLREKYNIPVIAHEEEKEILEDGEKNWSGQLGQFMEICADEYITEKEIKKFGDYEIRFLHTPGHTKGGMCIHVGNYLFTGDTLFKQSIGRTDLPTGSMRSLLASLNKIVQLDKDTIVLPGHGPASTVGFEKEHNTFITRFQK
ncbi:MAG: MBL fold metallo-hydrolase [Tissierellia bacterium]|nr:MBL fold metallo-hydrolase [Tissierellia bacterium]